MSACNILFQKRRRAVHMMVDGAGYDLDGVIKYIGQKAYALPTLHAAVSTLGVGLAGLFIPIDLTRRFSSFDEMADGLQTAAPSIYSEIIASSEAPINDVTLNIIGWSTREDGPASYMLKMNEPAREEELSFRDAQHHKEYGEGAFVNAPAFKLERTDFSTINPPPYRPLNKIGFPNYDLSEDIGDQVENVELDLLHILEAQRRRKFAVRPGCESAHKVGGLALVTSVTADGIFQKIVHRWTEDQIGEPIAPMPIDWKEWRAQITTLSAAKSTTANQFCDPSDSSRRKW